MNGRNRRPRVLIVDDDAGIRSLVSAVLADEGYEVASAVDGQDALDHCRDRCPDVILLDINMPRLNGRDFLELYRRDDTCGAHVVVFSALSDVQGIATEMRADAFLRKPFIISELAETMRLHTI
jgi:DNA-binding response OmpR family regulator